MDREFQVKFRAPTSTQSVLGRTHWPGVLGRMGALALLPRHLSTTGNCVFLLFCDERGEGEGDPPVRLSVVRARMYFLVLGNGTPGLRAAQKLRTKDFSTWYSTAVLDNILDTRRNNGPATVAAATLVLALKFRIKIAPPASVGWLHRDVVFAYLQKVSVCSHHKYCIGLVIDACRTLCMLCVVERRLAEEIDEAALTRLA